MNILHINLARGFRGGERQTLLLIRGLSEQYPEIQQSLVIRRDSPLQEYTADINNLILIKISRPWFRHLFSIKNHDLAHAHDAKACHFAFLLSLVSKIPYVITRRMDRAPKNDWFTRRVYRHCSHLISLSSAIADIMAGIYPELPGSVIPSMKASLDFNRDTVKAIRNQYPNSIIAGNIGALVANKGQQYTIEAARILENTHPQIHFLLVGEGPDREKFERQARGLKNLTFAGFRRNIGDYYRAFDIFLFPSLQEGLGSSLLDAMETRLPIIASRVGGIPDIIRDRENGLLVPVKDSGAIVNALLELIENKRFAQKLAAQGHKDADNYQPLIISRACMDIYKTLCKS